MNLKLKKIYTKAENKRLINNIIGTVGIKGIAMFLTLFTMPSYIRYFANQEVLGVWFSLVSILNWILTFDLGIGNGLRNQLVVPIAEKNKKRMKELISSAYFLLGIVSLILGIVGYWLIGIIDFNKVLNVSENVIKADVLNLSVRIVFCGIVIQFLKIVTSIFYAMQKTALPNLLALLSSIAVLAFVNIYSSKDVETKLIALSFAQVITMCLPLLFANIVVFMTGLKDSKPNIHFFDLNTGKAVVGLGGKFFVIQVSLLVITSTNEMLISNLSGSAHVVEYQTYNRIFSMVIVLFSLLIQPMWSAFSQANATKNYKWMRNVYTKFKIFAALGSVGCFFIAFIFDTIVKIWLGTDVVEIYLVYALCFAVLTSITLFVNSATSIANGMNELRCQMLWTVIGAIAKIPLSFILVYLFNAWIGVIISNIIVLIPLVVFQSWSSNKKLIQRERELVYETTKTYLI